MKTIYASSYNEIQKMLAKKGTKLFLLLAFVLPVLTKLIIDRLFITEWMILPNENITYMLLDLFTIVLLPLFIFIEATVLFTSEAERGTLFQIRPIHRWELFLSKMCAISVLTLVQLLTVWASTLLSSAILDHSFNLTIFFQSLSSFVLSWIPLLVIIAFAILIAQCVRSSVLSISILLILYMVMQMIPYLIPNLLYMLPIAYLDWYMQWIGNVSLRWVIQSFTYLGSSFALLLLIGYYIFSRKEA